MSEESRPEADARAADVVTVPLPATLCRRCVRLVSRRVRDVPGVMSFEVDVARGVVRVRGDVDREALLAALVCPS
ncbi:heavy-metal-associated domain-containing protein [Micromonospora sp. NPDC049679]|uniref:heavy-metal-associated domain-containing protein n=1 Tax=Micromonospora sp. NPDC049679 TaxID=3155920 RepID=UPI0033ED1A95